MLVPLPHRPHVAHPRRGHQQAHAGVAHPERRQPLELLGDVVPEALAAHHRVDRLGADQVALAERRARVGDEGVAEVLDAAGLDLQAGRGAMAPVARAGAPRRHPARPAGRSPGCCAPSPCPGPRRRSRSGRPAPSGAQPGARRRSPPRPDASPPRRAPAPAPRRARRGARRAPARRRSSTSRSVSRRSRLARSSSAAIAAARSSSAVSISSTPASARYRRPAALIRGPSRKARSPSSRRSGRTPAAAHSARSPGRRRLARHREPGADERPVLAPQRNQVGDRRQRHQVEVVRSPARRPGAPPRACRRRRWRRARAHG